MTDHSDKFFSKILLNNHSLIKLNICDVLFWYILGMDPYTRIRVGHYIYETQTDQNGGKTPRWNRVFHTQLPNGVNKIFLEIYDECNFTMDELITWAEIRIHEDINQMYSKII